MLGRIIAWLVAVLIVNTVVVVALRYGFNISITVLQESIVYLHATIFMLGACYTFQKDGHVCIDVVSGRLSRQLQAIIKITGNLLLLAPFALTLLWVSKDYVWYSWALREHSPEADGLPWVYLLKTLIPLLAIGLLLSGIADTIKQVKLLTEGRQQANTRTRSGNHPDT